MEPQHEPKKQSLKERLKALWNYFSTYEKIWFFSILILASVFAVLFPEEDVNGVNGGLIMALYLADTFLNILCELLISKQSKWNFIVSVFVEITEILICVVLAYRFATRRRRCSSGCRSTSSALSTGTSTRIIRKRR